MDILDPKTGLYSIAEVSRMLDVPVPTLRSWERRYRMVEPVRTPGGHRRYQAVHIERLRTLRDEIVRGVRPREAARGVRAEPPATTSGAAGRFLDLMLSAAIDLDGLVLRRALDDAAIELGIERAITDVVLAGLRTIGDQWKVGECDVAHEHLASAEVRSWLARRHAMAPAPIGRDTIVAACAPDEAHSFGLESFALLMALRGWRCVTLGARTPVASLREAVEQVNPVAVVVAAQYTGSRRSGVESVRAVTRLRGPTVFVGGAAFKAPQTRKAMRAEYLADDVVDGAVALDARLRGR